MYNGKNKVRVVGVNLESFLYLQESLGGDDDASYLSSASNVSTSTSLLYFRKNQPIHCLPFMQVGVPPHTGYPQVQMVICTLISVVVFLGVLHT